MQRWIVVGGAFLFMVGLGFVCPQIATLRDHGMLLAWQVLLLGLGVSLASAGVVVGGRAASSLVSRNQTNRGS